jgi:hypothetical protein
MSTQERGPADELPPACNVSMTFNFSVGAVSVIVAIAIAYAVMRL